MQEMRKLVDRLNDFAYRYYVLDEPIVSDKEYDELYDRLVVLERESGFAFEDSPTKRVGGEPLKKFLQHTHRVRLFSLDKVKSMGELDEWVNRLRKNTSYSGAIKFSLEHKFDGLTLNLTYDKGRFVRATTRGDGVRGEDVTEQVKTIKSVPLAIAYTGLVEVQGEGIMRWSAFNNYNKTAKEPLKNPRNAAAGAIRNLDPKVTRGRNLDIIFFGAECFVDKSTLASENEVQGKAEGGKYGALHSQGDVREFLRANHFKVDNQFLITDDIELLKKEIEKIGQNRGNLDYLIDGAVVKVNDFAIREEVGYTEKFPRFAVAFKFEAEEATATVLDVSWNVGRTGRITPLAHLTPVDIGGATIKNATLNNIDDIKRKNITINSRVFIRRSNDVIPEILGIAEEAEDAKEIIKPVICPSCGTLLEERGPNIFCPNTAGCRNKTMASIVHYCSKDALDIEGVSEKTVEALCDNLAVQCVADLYSLTKEQLLSLDKFKDKKADNFLAALERSKECSLQKFIFALGINNIGQVAARELAKKYKSIDKIMQASVEELALLKDFGSVSAEAVASYFDNEANLKMLDRLAEAGVNPIFEEPKDTIEFFDGKKFVLTGSLQNFTRTQAKALIEQSGGSVGDSVSRDTDYLIAGEDAGSKKEKAVKLGIKIISEADFASKINKI